MPTLRQLKMLCLLAETERFGETANRLGIAQSAVTAGIRSLEERLGLSLFDRGRHGARLTPAGESLLARARRIVQDVEDLERYARRDAAQLGGAIRLGCLPTVGPYLLPRATRRLHADFPDLKLIIREGTVPGLRQLLMDSVVDAILTVRPEFEGVDGEELFAESVHLALPPDDVLAGTGALALSALKGRDLLTLGESHQLGRLTLRFAEQAGAQVRTDYLGTSLDALRLMVSMGTGLALMPQLYILSEIEGRDDVVVRPIDSVHASRTLHLVWLKRSGRAQDFARLASIIRDAAEERLGPATEPLARPLAGR